MSKKKKYVRKTKGVKNKESLFLWVKPDTKEHIRRMAEEHEITLSKYAEKVLVKDMKRHQ